MPSETIVFLALQAFVVLFLALHDWVPLPPLNDVAAVQAADSKFKLVAVTLISTLPFAAGLAGSAYYAGTNHYPDWLMWTLWLSYGGIIIGMLRAWWIPYLLAPNPARAARYQAMFSRTHAFLPSHNGIRPNTLHILLHVVLIVIAVLLVRFHMF